MFFGFNGYDVSLAYAFHLELGEKTAAKKHAQRDGQDEDEGQGE